MPWDRTTAANVSVTIDPTVTGSATTITCSPFDSRPSYSPCNDPAPVTYVVQSGTTVITAGPVQPLRAGWHLWIEIVDDATGATRARVCEAEFTDLPGVCYPHSVTCSPAGSITINQLPV